MSNKREFTGVFIPANIWTSKELLPAEKMLLGEIDALSKATGWCEAGREHFAEWLQCTAQNVTYYFSKLQRLGFIEQVEQPGYRTRRRVINARFYEQVGVNGIYGGGKGDLRVGVNGIYGGGKGDLPEIKEEIKDQIKEEIKDAANAANPVFSIEIFEPSKTELLTLEAENPTPPQVAPAPPAPRRRKSETAEHIWQVVEVVEYLNSRAGTRYRPNTGETAKLINGRIRDGYSMEEIRQVIDHKCAEWLGTDMQAYLSPSTLFRPANFEKYLNAANMPKVQPKPQQAPPTAQTFLNGVKKFGS